MALDGGMPEAEVRSLTFFALVLCIIGLIFVNRSFSASIVTAFRRRNAALRWVTLAVAVMMGITLPLPFAQRMFRFAPLDAGDLMMTAGAGLEPRMRLIKVSTEEAPGPAGELAISSIPILVLFAGGREVARPAGAMPAGRIIAWAQAAVPARLALRNPSA